MLKCTHIFKTVIQKCTRAGGYSVQAPVAPWIPRSKNFWKDLVLAQVGPCIWPWSDSVLEFDPQISARLYWNDFEWPNYVIISDDIELKNAKVHYECNFPKSVSILRPEGSCTRLSPEFLDVSITFKFLLTFISRFSRLNKTWFWIVTNFSHLPSLLLQSTS